MRELAVLDYKNYIENGTVEKRPSVRGIIIRGEKISMVHSLKLDYYKFPGGGINAGETHIEALIREVREEAGLIVIPNSVRAYGYVIRKDKGKTADLFYQENFYYLCEAEEKQASQDLDDYEAEEQFVPEWVKPETAIQINLRHDYHGKASVNVSHMMEREAGVLRMLIAEGYFRV